MIYAINKETKEHRIIERPVLGHYPDVGWVWVEADENGWIPFNGVECPLPDDVKCYVGMSHGWRSKNPLSAGGWFWDSITTYLPILESESAELGWDGGPQRDLPPSGIECESWCDDKSEWLHVKTLDAYTNSGEMACTTIEPSGHFRRLFWGHKFRPLRTAAQRAEDEAVEEMMAALGKTSGASGTSGICRSIYYAIRDGKIPGIKLEE